MAAAEVHGLDDGLMAIETLVGGLDADRPVIGLTGPVGAGKTTLARRVAELLGGTLVSSDRYLPDYSVTPNDERDHPRSSSLEELAGHIGRLREGENAVLPVWSFAEHRRVSSETVESGRVIVVEGIHALAEPVEAMLDLAVFVEAPAGERLARWDAIESAGERGMGVEKARVFFSEVAEPTFALYANGYRRRADLVVVNPGRPG